MTKVPGKLRFFSELLLSLAETIYRNACPHRGLAPEDRSRQAMEFDMSTLAILPVSSVAAPISNFSTGNSADQQTTFDSLLSQLQTAISAGDLNSSQSLLHALDAIAPTSPAQNSALGALLSGVGAALEGGSFPEAQSALTTYLNATSSPPATPAASSAQSATAASIANNLVQSQLQLNLVSALLLPPGTSAPAGAADSVNSLVAFLNTAYGNGDGASSSAAGTSQSPYDVLVSALKANLAAGISTAGPALAYLQSKGSLVSVEA
jgi:hypothetical protein